VPGLQLGWLVIPSALRDELIAARAKAPTIGLGAIQLLAIGTQRRAWERRMGELLVGAPAPAAATPPDLTRSTLARHSLAARST